MTRERLSIRAKALSLLAAREYSRVELQRKLATWQRRNAAANTEGQQDATADDNLSAANALSVLLDEFETRGWLSDARLVEQAVNRLSRRYGARRVVQVLREKGVSRESVEAARPYLKSQALTSARDALQRRFNGIANTPEERARRMRFLQGRGFDYDVIRKALDAPGDDDS